VLYLTDNDRARGVVGLWSKISGKKKPGASRAEIFRNQLNGVNYMPMIYSVQGRKLLIRYSSTSFGALHASNKRAITEFNFRTSGRIKRYLSCCNAVYSLFGTLTYPSDYPTDGREVKRHLANFIKRLRRQCYKTMRPDEYGSWSVFWFLEFQQRGAPHFHFFCTHSPVPTKSGYEDRPEQPIELARKWMAKAWFECVGSGDEKHLRAGTQLDYFRTGRAGTISYASKYARKQEQKRIPEGFSEIGRFWGVSGLRTTMSADFVLNDRQMMHKDGLYLRTTFLSGIKEMQKRGEVDIHYDKMGQIRWCYMKTDQARKTVLNALRVLKLKHNALFDVADYDWEPWDILDEEMCDMYVSQQEKRNEIWLSSVA